VAEEGGSDQLIGAEPAAPEVRLDPNPTRAVFISYASQDTAVAEGLCAALEREGVACWMAPRNVRPGDFYANAIVDAISACPVMVLVLSKSAMESPHILREVERASAKKRPIIAFRIDDASLPSGFEYFLSASQWIDTSGGRADRLFPKLAEAVRSRMALAPKADSNPRSPDGTRPRQNLNRPVVAVIAIIALALVYFVADKFWLSKHAATVQHEAASPTAPALATAPAPTFAPPPHSIAVLPFVNMSGDAKQEYFSDGLSEELLNALSRLNDLQVVARTSSFSFKGQNVDIATIAHKLNVGAVLEGSVRRAGNTVRITVQLINAVSGFHMWSQTYDRDLKDILQVQTEVATQVAQQLKVKLVGDETDKIELGGTKNPQAYDAYLRGMQILVTADSEASARAAVASFDRAVMLDPNFASAYAQRARALSDVARDLPASEAKEGHDKELYLMARQSAERAVALAPALADAHIALGWHVLLFGYLDFTTAQLEIERALTLAPGSAYVLRTVGSFQGLLGHAEAAQAAVGRAILLDPQNYQYRLDLVWLLVMNRRFTDALVANAGALALNPGGQDAWEFAADIALGLGQAEKAQQICESPTTPLYEHVRYACLALAYHALGKQNEAESTLEEFKASAGDTAAFEYAEIYAQWGDAAAALRWLTIAERTRDPGLISLKVDWRLDPLRNNPQFRAIEARMNFPQ